LTPAASDDERHHETAALKDAASGQGFRVLAGFGSIPKFRTGFGFQPDFFQPDFELAD